ncbi:EAL domain-containing response regulator [Candidatus Magnetaquicoccus inordinatus]|uniref:EAL domain-containing response regulator n=1 Tax=Candidatus Magnetaquicoccus inordinatus TaxID=2496818 RepID=UPI00102C7050|nr:diguanylate cyclase [Candidatus Magnetaquicoccus inordinatus]
MTTLATTMVDSGLVYRILIVDDDGFTRMLLRSALEDGGYEVTEAADGEQALHEVGGAVAFDLLITDLNMPGMTGTELVQRLRKDGVRLPIIVLSGNNDVGTAIGVIHDGADDYLLKDENIESTVLFAVGKLLDKVRIEKENRQLLEALQHSNKELAAELVIRQQNEAQIQRDFESRTVIYRLLESAMTGLPLSEQLAAMLEVIVAVSWMDLQAKGAIFLLDPHSGDLLLRAACGLSQQQQSSCARVAATQFHQTLCGRALAEGRILFVGHDQHEQGSNCTGISGSSRYLVPILLQQRPLGVLKLYLAHERQPLPEEELFLQSISSTLSSVLERKQLEEALKQKAEYDALTGFANRALFYDRLTQAITASQRNGKDLVLMFIDLDRFKQVNDTLGHEAGDRLLQEAARRIAGCLRGTDLLARLGGDEFTVILPWLTHAFYIEYVARRILEELNKPFHLPQGEGSISGSIGITFFPNDAETMEQLLKNADAAMYQAKEAGRSTFRFFTPEMNEAAAERARLERAITLAWDNREFAIYYQPRVAAKSGRVVAMESQLRWHRETAVVAGQAMVAELFLPHLEQTDLMVPVGLWMLESVCRQYHAWMEAGYAIERVSIPLSLRYLQQGMVLLEMIQSVLRETGVPADRLELEIGCAVLLSQWEKMAPLFEMLQGLGVTIALRDVGLTPFSPAILQAAGVRVIKLDRGLWVGLPDDSGRGQMIRGWRAMAEAMGWRLLVDGIDTAEDRQFWQEYGGDLLQGELFAPALSVQACTQYLQAQG